MSELHNLDGLVQERRNSIANALELCLTYTNPSIGSVENISQKLTIQYQEFTISYMTGREYHRE